MVDTVKVTLEGGVRDMRNPERIDRILALIGKAWKSSPDMRFFQLLTAMGLDGDLFYYEDDDLEQWLKKVTQ